MLKKLLFVFFALMVSISAAFAAVDVNTADQASLEAVKGLGPVKSKAIVDERAKNGPFKNADDLATRVKGLGTKSVTNLEAAGLTVNGSATPPTGAKAATKAKTPAAAKSTPTTQTAAPAAATVAAPAATAPLAASSAAPKTKRGKKKAAAAAAEPGASAAVAASGAKTKKSRAKKGAASAAAAQ